MSGDGLHKYRRQVYGIIIAMPILLAGLPFVNSGPAYTAQGAFCALPRGPIRYRLAQDGADGQGVALTWDVHLKIEGQIARMPDYYELYLGPHEVDEEDVKDLLWTEIPRDVRSRLPTSSSGLA